MLTMLFCTAFGSTQQTECVDALSNTENSQYAFKLRYEEKYQLMLRLFLGCLVLIISCSLCHNGILGGGLYLDSQSLTYKTNKLTVDKKYRNLVLPMQEIKEISWKWIVFPIATVNMKNGELYKFIIFNKSRFAKWFQEYSR